MYKVSILIPVYNVELYIEKCLNSIFANTIIKDCEIILLNDKSTDNSLNIVESVIKNNPSLKNNIKIYQHEKNEGIAKTRADLLNYASGKYFIFVDSDDYVEKNYLELLYNKAKETDSDIAVCDYIVHDLKGNVNVEQFGITGTAYECIKAKLLGKNVAYLPVKLVKTEIVKNNNLSFISGLNLCEDDWFTFEIFCYANRIEYVQQPLYHYVLRKKSISMQLFDDSKVNSVIEYTNKIEQLLLSKFDNQEIKELIFYRKMNRKKYLLLNVNIKKQKELRKLWIEKNTKIQDIKFNIIFKVILLGKNKLLYSLLLFLLMFIKIIRRKCFTLRDYLGTNKD